MLMASMIKLVSSIWRTTRTTASPITKPQIDPPPPPLSTKEWGGCLTISRFKLLMAYMIKLASNKSTTLMTTTTMTKLRINPSRDINV
jgi:hypothetical protein